MLDIEGPRLKLQRAEQHQARIAREVQAFLKARPFSCEARVEPDTKSMILYGKITRALPPLWSLLIGEFAHNARSALDLMVYQTAPPEVQRAGRSGFPIYRRRENYFRDGPWAPWLTEPQREFIEAEQPFNHTADGPAKFDLLAVLADLNNTDKHELIPVVGAVAGFSAVVTFDEVVHDVETEILGGGIIRKDGDPVARIRAIAPKGVKMEIAPHFTMQVQFGEGTVAENTSVPDLLREVHTRAATLVEEFGKLFPQVSAPGQTSI